MFSSQIVTMKKLLLAALALALFTADGFAETVLEGKQASEKIPGASVIRYKDNIQNPSFIRFIEGKGPLESEIQTWVYSNFSLAEGYELTAYSEEGDIYGFTHIRFNQIYQGIPVEYTSLVAHIKNGRVETFSGYTTAYAPASAFSLSEGESLEKALTFVNAEVYKWEIPEEEAFIKWESEDPEASFYPTGEKVYLPENADFTSENIIPCWKFNIYASKPLYRAHVYVSAVSGEVMFEDMILKDVDTNTTANTSYSGNRIITTDYRSVQNNFRLRETGRGDGIRTFDMLNGTNHGNAVDILSNVNFWLDTGRAEYATDAHWGAEMVYDYYLNVHGRNSFDGNGIIMRSYVHYDVNYANAFWDGQRMTYGDGNSSISALTTVDIAGHEITHGVDQYTSNLIYQNESGALDESFADIFGNTVEASVKPDPIKNWLVGEEIGITLRSMSDPKSRQDPDTYLGQYYYLGTADNGGVHTNSGVQNYWFYLLSIGGTGTNDNNDAYNVSGISMLKAEQIAYRNRAFYLSSTSDYEDARFFSIQSAFDIYGACSPELASTVNAWYAVGLGNAYVSTVVSDFEASSTEICFLPAKVQFENLSNYNSVSYLWDFGDGNSSMLVNPEHTYSAPGTYTVKLTAIGNSTCGSDTENKVNYITVEPPADVQSGPYTICEGYPAKIRVTASDTAFWYADQTSTIPLFIGNPYISPVLMADTFFYVANGIPGQTQLVGPVDNTIGQGAVYSSLRYLVFDVYNTITLQKVTVYSFNTKTRIIELRNSSGTPIQSKMVSIGTGQHEIDLNFVIEPGTDYQLSCNDADFFRNSTGANYPYTISNLASITGPGNAPSSYYYFFYNWKIKGGDCVGTRNKVDVTIDFDPNCIPYLGENELNTLNSGVNVYPNPSTGIFNVEFELNKKTELSFRLIDSKGSTVFSDLNKLFESGKSIYTFEEGALPIGIYLLQIEGQNYHEIKKVVIN